MAENNEFIDNSSDPYQLGIGATIGKGEPQTQ